MAIKILLVDDSKTMRNICKVTISKAMEAEYTEAENGLLALDAVKAKSFDIILLDWNMPKMNGLSFLENLRKSDMSTPVIMVTTEAEKSRIVTAIKAGVSGYLIKPFTPEALNDKVNETLKTARIKNKQPKICSLQTSCSYFNNPVTAHMEGFDAIKEEYCDNDKTKCAIRTIINETGESSIPNGMKPKDTIWAHKLIESLKALSR